MADDKISEHDAAADLRRRGVWRLAPGLWCDSSVPDLISVAADMDTARDVRLALAEACQLPCLES